MADELAEMPLSSPMHRNAQLLCCLVCGDNCAGITAPLFARLRGRRKLPNDVSRSRVEGRGSRVEGRGSRSSVFPSVSSSRATTLNAQFNFSTAEGDKQRLEAQQHAAKTSTNSTSCVVGFLTASRTRPPSWMEAGGAASNLTCQNGSPTSPALFRRKSQSEPSTLLLPLCSFQHRASRVFDLSLSSVPVSSSRDANSTLSPANNLSITPQLNACPAVYAPYLCAAFNRYSRELYQRRIRKKVPVRAAPLLFTLQGQAIDHTYLPYIAHRGPLFAEMPSSCKDIREALAQCLQESDCVMIYRNKPSDCLRPPLIDDMPTKCQQLKKGLGECKRGMVDMRKRFRGNQPIAMSKEIEGGGGGQGHQLYAGKPAFGTAVKETAGREPEEKDWRDLENEKYNKS